MNGSGLLKRRKRQWGGGVDKFLLFGSLLDAGTRRQGHAMTLLSRPKRREQIISQEGVNDFLLLNMRDGNYYSLNEVGGRIWSLCDGKHTVEQIVESLAAEYDATAEILTSDALDLLDELRNQQLISESEPVETA